MMIKVPKKCLLEVVRNQATRLRYEGNVLVFYKETFPIAKLQNNNHFIRGDLLNAKLYTEYTP